MVDIATIRKKILVKRMGCFSLGRCGGCIGCSGERFWFGLFVPGFNVSDLLLVSLVYFVQYLSMLDFLLGFIFQSTVLTLLPLVSKLTAPVRT